MAELMPPLRGLTVLSAGMGQDTAAMIAKIMHDPEFRATYVGDNDLVCIFSDTLNEHPYTYEYLADTKARLEKAGIPFLVVTPGEGYHTGMWAHGGLYGAWLQSHTIGSVGYNAVCSVRLKQDPLYRRLAEYIRVTYGYTEPEMGSLQAFVRDRDGRKIEMLIGFARGEEKRVPKPAPPPAPELAFMSEVKKKKIRKAGDEVWRKESIRLRFPLIDLAMDRTDCQQYVASVGDTVPWPSQCKFCHFKGPIELLVMVSEYPESFVEWVAAEARKIAFWSDENFRRYKLRKTPDKFKPNATFRNIGVSGKGHFKDGKFVPETLLDQLDTARKMYGHMTREELREHVFSRGHCVKSGLKAA